MIVASELLSLSLSLQSFAIESLIVLKLVFPRSHKRLMIVIVFVNEEVEVKHHHGEFEDILAVDDISWNSICG